MSFLASFFTHYDHEFTAVLSVVLAVLIATLLDRLLVRQGRRLAASVSRRELEPVAKTRLRFTRHLIYLLIVSIGVALALAQFTRLNQLATTFLASGAIIAAFVGLASQGLLSHTLAGLTLTITGSVRIGDYIRFEGHEGTVEQIRLTHTYLRTPSQEQLVVPNAKLVSEIIYNDTVLSEQAPVTAVIRLPLTDQLGAMIKRLEQSPEIKQVRLGEITEEVAVVKLIGAPGAPSSLSERRDHLLRSALDSLGYS